MKRTKRELVHKDFLTVVRNTYEAEDGRIVVREMVEHPGAAVVVPMVGKDEVLLVEQFRPGPNKPLLELPAGLLEANEDPRDCAARELEEETGYRAEKVEHLFSAYSSPGILQEQFHIFLATGLQHVGAQRDEDEGIIDVRKLNFRELRIQLRSGNIKDMKTLGALSYILVFKPYLGAEVGGEDH